VNESEIVNDVMVVISIDDDCSLYRRPRDIIPRDMSLEDDPFGAPLGWQFPKSGFIY